jgi:hypothetical protein
MLMGTADFQFAAHESAAAWIAGFSFSGTLTYVRLKVLSAVSDFVREGDAGAIFVID